MRVHVGQKSSTMNLVYGLVNWVHWTQFVSLETEFIGLSFNAYKPSPMNSVYKPRNRVHWTQFASPETESFVLGFIWVHVSIIACTQKILKTQKNTQFKKHSLSLSFPLTVSLSLTFTLLSISVTLSLSLSCSVTVIVCVRN